MFSDVPGPRIPAALFKRLRNPTEALSRKRKSQIAAAGRLSEVSTALEGELSDVRVVPPDRTEPTGTAVHRIQGFGLWCADFVRIPFR